MNVTIDQQTAERAAQALRSQAREKQQASESARRTVPGGLIADPSIVAQHLSEESERAANAAQEIETALGWDNAE